MDIAEQIARWQAGDQRAARWLYDQHSARLYRLAYALLGNGQDAEEVTQDALTYALLNIDRYDAQRAQFSTWLHTIAVSRVRDRQRRKRFKLLSLNVWQVDEKEPLSDQPAPEAWAAEQLMRREVWQAVQQLSPVLREAIVLRYWAQHSFVEMASIMACPLGTAQSRVRRAFEQLRDTLTPEMFE